MCIQYEALLHHFKAEYALLDHDGNTCIVKLKQLLEFLQPCKHHMITAFHS